MTNKFSQFLKNLNYKKHDGREYEERSILSKIGVLADTAGNLHQIIGNQLIESKLALILPKQYKQKKTDRLHFYYYEAEQGLFSDKFIAFCEETLDEFENLFSTKIQKRTKVILIKNLKMMDFIYDTEAIGLARCEENLLAVRREKELDWEESYNYFLETTRHEFSHLYSHQLNPELPLAIEEGFATYLQNPKENGKRHRIASEFLREGQIDNIYFTRAELFMSEERSSIHYCLSGSFTSYLIETFGIDTFMSFYQQVNSGNIRNLFVKIFSKNYRECENDWKKQVSTK